MQETIAGGAPIPRRFGRAPTHRAAISSCWIVFGIAIAIGSWNMDRLESQNINPYTVPGLVPGLLGLAMVFFGALMALRAWRAGALAPTGTASRSADALSAARGASVSPSCCRSVPDFRRRAGRPWPAVLAGGGDLT